MKADVKQMWVEALRSGEYVQGHYQLREGEFYDPVGVLMDLAAKQGIISQPEERTAAKGAEFFFGWLYDGESVRISRTVSEWSGLEYWTANHIMHRADAARNGWDFNACADYIEKEL